MGAWEQAERERQLALIDPWRPLSALPPATAYTGAMQAHSLRRHVGWSNWRLWLQIIGGWLTFSGMMALLAIFGSLFMMSGAPGARPWIVMWAVITLLAPAVPLLIRWLWAREYRHVYYDLTRSDLPLRVLDEEQWRSFLHPDGVPSAPGMVPQTTYDALRLATYFYPELRALALPDETAPWQRWLSLLRRGPGGFGTNALARGAMDLLLAMKLPSQEPEVNARYAALYDYFFAPQERLAAAQPRPEA